jgi:hypothetical protein
MLMKIALPLTISLGMMTVMICLSLGMVTALPPDATIPVPFDLGLAPNHLAPAGLALSLMPAAVLVATAAFALHARSSQQMPAQPERYVVVWLAVILLLAIGHGLIIRGALISLQAS